MMVEETEKQEERLGDNSPCTAHALPNMRPWVIVPEPHGNAVDNRCVCVCVCLCTRVQEELTDVCVCVRVCAHESAGASIDGRVML